jgi:hypothetical protein
LARLDCFAVGKFEDFPSTILDPLNLDAKSADAFIADTVALDERVSSQTSGTCASTSRSRQWEPFPSAESPRAESNPGAKSRRDRFWFVRFARYTARQYGGNCKR